MNASYALSLSAHFTESRVLFLLLAVTVLLYADSLGSDFLYRDPKQIVSNPPLRSWSSRLHPFTDWSFPGLVGQNPSVLLRSGVALGTRHR